MQYEYKYKVQYDAWNDRQTRLLDSKKKIISAAEQTFEIEGCLFYIACSHSNLNCLVCFRGDPFLCQMLAMALDRNLSPPTQGLRPFKLRQKRPAGIKGPSKQAWVSRLSKFGSSDEAPCPTAPEKISSSSLTVLTLCACTFMGVAVVCKPMVRGSREPNID